MHDLIWSCNQSLWASVAAAASFPHIRGKARWLPEGKNKKGTMQDRNPFSCLCLGPASLPQRRVWQGQQVSECLWLILLRPLFLINLVNFGAHISLSPGGCPGNHRAHIGICKRHCASISSLPVHTPLFRKLLPDWAWVSSEGLPKLKRQGLESLTKNLEPVHKTSSC